MMLYLQSEGHQSNCVTAQVHFNLSLGRAFGGTVVAKPIMLWLDPFLRTTLADLIVWPNRIVVPLSYDPDFDYSVLEMRCGAGLQFFLDSVLLWRVRPFSTQKVSRASRVERHVTNILQITLLGQRDAGTSLQLAAFLERRCRPLIVGLVVFWGPASHRRTRCGASGCRISS